MELLDVKTGVSEFLIAEDGDNFYVFNGQENYDSEKHLRKYDTLAECKAFCNGVYWACMRAAFGKSQ